MTWIEAAGWAGSILLVVSILQGGMLRLRILNLIASIILVAYNLLVGVWPMVAMNLAVAVIDIYFIAKIQRGKASSARDLEPRND